MEFDAQIQEWPAAVAKTEIKEVLVPPLRARGETIGLIGTITAIVLLMALRFAIFTGQEDKLYLRPYQRLDSILQGPQRTLYQSLLAVVPDVLDIRDQEGQWPEAELLEMENLPPFDNKFLPQDLRTYEWTGYDKGSWIDYCGQNPTGEHPVTFLLRIIDIHARYHPHPHPGVDYDPNQPVAVQVWIYPEPNRPYPGERLPEAGWWWVVRPDDPFLKEPPKDKTTQTGSKAVKKGVMR